MFALVPIFSTLLGAVLGGFFGFLFQTRQRRSDLLTVSNVLAIEIESIQNTLLYVRFVLPLEFELDAVNDQLRVATYSLKLSAGQTRFFDGNIAALGRLGPQHSESVVRFYLELAQINVAAENVNLALKSLGAALEKSKGGAATDAEIQKIVNWYGVNWNLYLNHLEAAIDRANVFLGVFGKHLEHDNVRESMLKNYAQKRGGSRFPEPKDGWL
ncbi:MAG TPA: hypothetical protein VMF58_11300 [Rhizomicrobium sp.]|nr:hypothetical protein [Rhizomicrobium sp.]